MGMGGVTGATAAGPLGPAWTPLGSNPTGAGGIGGMSGFMTPPGSPGSTPTPGMPSTTPYPGTTTGSKEAPGKDTRRRYEFVVMLVWREPVPKIEANPDAATLTTPGTTMGSPSPMGGM